MKSLMSKARVFENYYGVGLVDVHMKDSVEDLTPSNFLAAYYRATYKRYIRFDKKKIKYEGVLPFEKLSKNTTVANNFRITHHEVPSFNTFSEQIILIMI